MTDIAISNTDAARTLASHEGLRVWAEIDLDRLAANVRGLKQRAGDARLLAVIKANAYGHGAAPVGRTALEAGAWGLGVIGVDEGEELRRAGIEAPVLVLGSSTPSMAMRIVRADLRATVGSLAMTQALSEAAATRNVEARVHVKVETGLNRYGLLPDDAVALAEAVRALPNIVVEGLATHLASVDEGDKTFTHAQYKLFRACADRLPWVPLHHIASTGAVLDLPDTHLAMVRTGIGIYGSYPSEEVSRSVALQPVMALRSRVARVTTIEAGESVGYGRTWIATRRSRIATVMAGYGDGVRRSLSSKGIDLVRGQRVPVVGRVAMDMHMVDVTDVPGVQPDDEVTLWGEQDGAILPVEEIAALAGTINYEMLTGVMARVPRLFLRGGRVGAVSDLAGYRELEN